MRREESYQEQRLVRSPFRLSLGRLHQLCSLFAAEGPFIEVHMLLEHEHQVPTDVDMKKG